MIFEVFRLKRAIKKANKLHGENRKRYIVWKLQNRFIVDSVENFKRRYNRNAIKCRRPTLDAIGVLKGSEYFTKNSYNK